MAYLLINKEPLLNNLRLLEERCRLLGAEFMLVFKEAGVRPELLRLLLEMRACTRMGLCHFPGYSPVAALSETGTQAHLLYLVPQEALPEVVAAYDVLYQTSLPSLMGLAREAQRQGRQIRVILPVEMGDGRDGVLPENLRDLATAMHAMRPHVELHGLAANFACVSDAPPTEDNIRTLAALGQYLREATGLALPHISVGGSDVLELAEAGGVPAIVTEIRCGTAAYLGHYPLSGRPVPGLSQKALSLCGRVVECSVKKGRMLTIFDFGCSDTNPECLATPHEGMTLKGVSSGYTVFDTTVCPHTFAYGEEAAFGLRHKSLARALTSPRLPLRME